MVKTKVFVGNLSFKTTEAELSKAFGVAGVVSSANIITRGPRSLGYGFVEMESEDAARKAVELLNKKDVDGRQINVDLAKPREEGEGSSPRTERVRGGSRGRRIRGGRGGSKGPSTATRGGRRESPETNSNNFRGAPRRGSGRPRGGRGGRKVSRPSIEQRPNTPSKTTLFVANLPFSLDDEGFGKIFTSHGIQVKSAKVVRRPNGSSKGFGFVEFEKEEDQVKGLALNQTKVGDPERELQIKIALTEKEEAKEEKKEESKEEQKPQQPKEQPPTKKEEKAPAAEQPKKEEKPAEPKKEQKAQPPKNQKK